MATGGRSSLSGRRRCYADTRPPAKAPPKSPSRFPFSSESFASTPPPPCTS
jgi:hypothetical protein